MAKCLHQSDVGLHGCLSGSTLFSTLNTDNQKENQ